MANIVITSNTNLLFIDFGNYKGQKGFPHKQNWHKASVHFSLSSGGDFVEVLEDNQSKNNCVLSYNGIGDTFQVDSIDGVAPISNSDLYDKLIALL